MKNLKPIVFTTLALSAFIFSTGCQTQTQKQIEMPEPDELKLIRAVHDKQTGTAKTLEKKGTSVNALEKTWSKRFEEQHSSEKYLRNITFRWAEASDWSAAMWSVWNWFEDRPLCAYIMHSGGDFGQAQKDALLERAARTGDIARAKVFLELGANPNYVNAFGENCATLALRYFRGQYGIAENPASLPRYAKLDDINAALKANSENAASAKKRLAEIQKAADAYKTRAETFAQSPQPSVDSAKDFEKTEFETASKFFRTAKNLKNDEQMPATLTTAAGIYKALSDEATGELASSEKTLQYVKFIALLKSKGANLRKLLAGTQDNSGTQTDWTGQEDKWTMDPVARSSVHKAFPYVVDGLWDGELALIQLIGRGDEIFKGQITPYANPVTPEFVALLYLNEYDRVRVWRGASEALFDKILENALSTRTVSWEGRSNTGWRHRYSSGNITFRRELTMADVLSAISTGSQKYLKSDAEISAAIDFLETAGKYLVPLNADIEKGNAARRAHYEKIFALFEEVPADEKLLEEWKNDWAHKKKAEAKFVKKIHTTLSEALNTHLARLERHLKQNNFVLTNPNIAVAQGKGSAQEVRNESDKMHEEYENDYKETTAKIKRIREFLASDFFKETPLEELLKNPPNPRDADPLWYAKNCLGKLKHPEVFTESAKAFLDFGTDVNARANGTNHPAFVCALLWDRPEFEELLLSYGADLKLALFHICERNDFDLLKKLLPRIKSLAEVPADGAGNTILHRAVLAGRADMIPEIVKRGVPVDVKNKHADTPLHLAAEKENEACVVALLDLSADVNAKDKDGRKPFQRFWNVPNPELTQRFVKAHAAAK